MVARMSNPTDFNDLVNAPAHYLRGGLESISVIEAFELNFRLGNAVKYILRAGHKGDRLEDLRKAQWYLAREIARSEAAVAAGAAVPRLVDPVAEVERMRGTVRHPYPEQREKLIAMKAAREELLTMKAERAPFVTPEHEVSATEEGGTFIARPRAPQA